MLKENDHGMKAISRLYLSISICLLNKKRKSTLRKMFRPSRRRNGVVPDDHVNWGFSAGEIPSGEHENAYSV